MLKVLSLFVALASLGIPFDLAAGSLPSSPTTVQATAPQQQPRAVKGQTLISPEMPACRLEFDRAFKYAGNQSFILYGVAHAEQHFFVDADKQNRINRLYWVQFEGYLPDNSSTYKYTVNKTVNIGGLEFIADTYARKYNKETARAGSDGVYARTYLESKGYSLASDIISQRLVHMVDEAKRNELMIIYIEDLSAMGLTAADLTTGGRAADRFEGIAKGVLERAVNGLKISR